MFHRIAIAAALAAAAIAPAQATLMTGTFAVTVSEGLTTGQINSLNGNPFAAPSATSNTAQASFTYTGPIAFRNTAPPTTDATGDLNSTFGFSAANISNYVGSGTVTATNGNVVANFATLTNPTNGGYLGSSGSSAVYQYASYYTFDLGSITPGTVLTIRHDDGVSLFQGTTRIGNTVTGATGAVTDVVRIDTAGDTILRYTRQNSTPSILHIAVPEPMSLGLLGASLAGVGLIRRRRQG